MQVVLDTMVPVLCVVAVGFLIEGRTPISMESLSQLALLVCSPCLIFAELARDHGAIAGGLQIVGATLFIMAVTGLVGFLGLGLLPGRPRGLLLPIMFWNAGNLGLSVARLARGSEGFEVATLAFVTVAAAQAVFAGWIASGRGGGLALLRMPIAWSAVLGILCSLSDRRPPEMVMEPIRILGEAAIPLLLVVLGMQLRRLKLTRPWPTIYAFVVRSGVGLLAGLAFTSFFAIEGVMRDVILIESVLPPAIISLMFAQRFGAAPEDVASAIVGGTLASFIVLPVLLALL